ncbi:hypothetical protein BDA99DRAFT_564726 [Phascolomyces articulosus]|uniref:Uncharacterized protein n=1 Tax=Phascolomyces articulosus TaxID=60185 RepID=A0AAD5JQ52_9FUNG|nr:hypothetical protein BDA99DRAFT_564726 [Phascolomyces articulosus]
MDQKLFNQRTYYLVNGINRALDTFLLRDMVEPSKVKKIYYKAEMIPMVLNTPKLGIGAEMYNKLKEEATVTLCCEWLLDFHQLWTVMTENILVDLSSISTTANGYDMTGADPPAAKIPKCYPSEDPRVALPMSIYSIYGF